MPLPLVGGAYSLKRIAPVIPEPEMEEFRQKRQYIQENIKCKVKFFKKVTPLPEGRVKGMVILEAKEDTDLEQCGMYIQMGGLPSEGKHLQTVKFSILGTSLERDDANIRIEGGTRESYPFEISLPEELPPPFITPMGKFSYTLQAFLSLGGGKKIALGEEVSIKWEESRVLTKMEVETHQNIEQELRSRRGYLTMGRRRRVLVEWVIDKGAFIPGDLIPIVMWGRAQNKFDVSVKCKVEVVQRVCYQIPSICEDNKLTVKRKTCVVSMAEEDVIVAGGGTMKVVWRTKLDVSQRLPPSYKFDCLNSVSYTIRVSVATENMDSLVIDELPIVIGSGREVESGIDVEEDEREGGDQYPINDVRIPSTSKSCTMTMSPLDPLMPATRVLRSGSVGFTSFQESSRPRTGSVSSIESWNSMVSGTHSMLNFPATNSQLSTIPESQGACKKFLNRLKHDIVKSFKFLIFLVPAASYDIDMQQQGMLSLTQEPNNGQKKGKSVTVTSASGPRRVNSSGRNRSQNETRSGWN